MFLRCVLIPEFSANLRKRGRFQLPAAPTGASAGSGPPAWAQRMKANQSMVHGVQTAAQVLKSGDSHGGGHSVDLSGGE